MLVSTGPARAEHAAARPNPPITRHRRLARLTARAVVSVALSSAAVSPLSVCGDAIASDAIRGEEAVELGRAEQALITTATYHSGAFTVNVDNRDPALPDQTILNLVDTFFHVYPVARARYNPSAPLEVDFLFLPDHPVPAWVIGNEISFSSRWMIDHPQDWDIVVHEGMHIVQTGADGPGFLIEGIADHVRNEYGVNNSVSGWVLTDEGAQFYMRGYGHTALFLMWIEDHYNASVVDGLMAAMVAHTYSEQTWVTLTSKTLNELWNEYRPWFPTPTDQVTFFQDIHYGGSYVSIAPGSYTLSALNALGVPNDWASSLWVPPGFEAELFFDDFFTGGSITLEANQPNFVPLGLNDTMSSLIVREL